MSLSFSKLILTGALGLVAAGCATAQPPVWAYDPQNNNVGRLYYYERSNVDGSKTERVTIFHRDENSVEVYKENGLCKNAALVTATMDWASYSASKITGGQLKPNAEHHEFAFLTWDQPNAILNVHVKFPNGEIKEEAPIRSTPWHLYDFDFASLTLATQHLASKKQDFDFGMALVWTDPKAEDPLTWMGEVKAKYQTEEKRLGRTTKKYVLTGSALKEPLSTSSEGALWLDAGEGHIVDAVLPVPNHAGYKDLRLKLLKTSDGGFEEWTGLLRAHFEECD